MEDYAGSSGDRQFDLITANHVLEHTPDPVRTLGVMKGLLAPGGKIWIAVPNSDCTFSRRLRSRWYSLDVPFHLMQFTMESLSKAGDLAGLKILSVRTYLPPGLDGRLAAGAVEERGLDPEEGHATHRPDRHGRRPAAGPETRPAVARRGDPRGVRPLTFNSSGLKRDCSRPATDRHRGCRPPTAGSARSKPAPLAVLRKTNRNRILPGLASGR